MNPLQPPSEWVGRDEGSPGYWTGTASMPRSAQHENVGIHIYSPLYADGGALGFFDYQALTHAYFPRDHFDQVERVGKWTVAQEGRRLHRALLLARHRVAGVPGRGAGAARQRAAEAVLRPGRAGRRRTTSGSSSWGARRTTCCFSLFVQNIREAKVKVTPRDTEFGHQTFDVVYDSPSQGRVEFGWDTPFEVRGREMPLAGYPRVGQRAGDGRAGRPGLGDPRQEQQADARLAGGHAHGGRPPVSAGRCTSRPARAPGRRARAPGRHPAARTPGSCRRSPRGRRPR